jgi:hypothetical protein
MDRREFSGDLKKTGKFSSWKERGKLAFVIHPGSKIGKRTRIVFRKPVYNEEKEEWSIWTISRLYKGKEDIVFKFVSWLKGNDKIDADDVVLRIKADDKVEKFTKGDLLGMKGYSWQKNIFRPRTEYLFCVVDLDGKRELEILSLPFGAGKKLNKVMDQEIEERGEEKGDPWSNPYPFRVTFDKNESGGNMYNASRSSVDMPEWIEDVFEQDPIDVLYYCDDESEANDDYDSKSLLKDMLVISCPFLEKDVEVEEEEPKKEKKKSSKSNSDVKAKDCEKGKYYKYDGEKIKFKRYIEDKSEALFIDEDGDRVRVEGGTVVRPFDESSSDEGSEEKPTNNNVRVEDCIKGETYYDSDGEKLKYIRYNSKKEKGVFDDSDDERVLLHKNEVVFLSKEEVEDADDALEPIDASREESDKEEPRTKEGQEESDEEEIMYCPNCEKQVAIDASKCKNCGAEFADDDEPFK